MVTCTGAPQHNGQTLGEYSTGHLKQKKSHNNVFHHSY